jgi:Sec-independent protein translocase protein TatA
MKLTEAAKKIGKVMGEYKEGKLKSSSGQKVKTRDQAVAIAMSEAKRTKKK